MVLDISDRRNYLFNSTINGIEEADLILLIGTNPRFEATMLNARIRKAYLNNKTEIISLNDVGDLTYPYENYDGKTLVLKDMIENNNDLSQKILKSKKPMIILGDSFFRLKSSNYLFNSLKNFFVKNNKITNDWMPLNTLSTNASTVGNYDLEIIKENSNLINELNENKFEIVFLIGQDDLKFNKKNEFVIYQGSHGDRGAEIADIILPGAAFTEQSGHFTNLEGKVQKAYKASILRGRLKKIGK